MPFCNSRAVQTARSSASSVIISNWLKTGKAENWINKNNSTRGAFESGVKPKLSSGNAEVIGVRKQAGINPAR